MILKSISDMAFLQYDSKESGNTVHEENIQSLLTSFQNHSFSTVNERMNVN